MSSTHNNLVDQYLLATPTIQDPLFASSLVYMCEHSSEGSMGVVVNHPSEQTLENMFEQLKISCHDQHTLDTKIYIGGPVQLQQGLVLHSSPTEWDRSIQIGETNFLTSSKDILESIAHQQGPEHFMVLLGYSGWSGGQLEQELQDNAWLTANASPTITYHADVDKKWQMAFDSLGFNLDKLSPTTGNA